MATSGTVMVYHHSFIKGKGRCTESLYRSVTGESRAFRLQYLLDDSKKDIQIILLECQAETLGPAAKEASLSCH